MRLTMDTSGLSEAGRADVTRFAVGLQAQSVAFTDRVVSTVAEHIPVVNDGMEATLRFVPRADADAYVEPAGGAWRMVIDLSRFLADRDEDTWANVYAAAYHEFWHVAFAEFIKSRWRVRQPYAVPDLDYALVFAMLDEGYGHYLSLVAYGQGKQGAHRILHAKGSTDEHTGYLDRFGPKIREFRASREASKRTLVAESHLGSMWSKWGALTGAWVISTLQIQVSREDILRSLACDPYEVWFLYQRACGSDGCLSADFLEMVRGVAQREPSLTMIDETVIFGEIVSPEGVCGEGDAGDQEAAEGGQPPWSGASRRRA